MTKSRACANSPALSRRNLMAGMAASGFTVALASDLKAAPSIESDPILPLYREWWALHLEWIRLSNLPGNENWDWPESIETENKERAVFQQMLEIKPTSLAGIAALAHVLWEWHGPAARPENADYAEECEWPEYKMMAMIWRAASGQTGLPPHHSEVAL